MRAKRKKKKALFPIEYWSHSSLMAFLRNPLAWYKRYVMKIYDTPKSPAAIIGIAGHIALQHFYQQVSELQTIEPLSFERANAVGKTSEYLLRKAYSGASKETATRLGLAYMRSVSDFELNLGVAKTVQTKKAKRAKMERDYLQAISFYLARAPRHRVLGVEVKGTAKVAGLPLPVKAVSDLVVESRAYPGALDIVDHKFVDAFTSNGVMKSVFLLQAIFNYYTVQELYGLPVRRFIVYECKKSRNANGKSQLRRFVLDYEDAGDAFLLFHHLLQDATKEISRERAYLPNPSDMFEGEDSLNIYTLGLIEEAGEMRET